MKPEAGKPDWAEVERAFFLASDLPRDQQAGFLAKLTPPMRAEVESLLRANIDAGSFLERGMEPSPSESTDPNAAIRANTTIGSYRIVGTLGKGGMGVVYRAQDSKLNRPVAIKFLFDDVADTTARRRFQREAQLASSLNHPHILTVYDIGEYEGRQYLVTEFVDGGTLRDWARTRKPDWRAVVDLLGGVADALAAAHSAGILHRDIKPENILVSRNGYAKLADFGLAKLESPSTPEMVTKTIQNQTTRPGVILGTLAYMSPEQASGRPTDACSDIFSFGVVLYELLAGRRPFRGATDLELLQTIIHGAAPPLPSELPLSLRMAVEKALANSPADRYQTARDLVVDLRRLSRQSADGSGSQATSPAAPPANETRAPKRTAWLAGLATLAVLVATGILWWRSAPPESSAPRDVVQFEIPQPPGTFFAPPITRQPLAISPDGKRLAFTATSGSGTVIWVRDLDSVEVKPLPATAGVWSLFWSPDSRSIYYSVKTTLKEVNLETGTGRTVAELSDIAQLGTWRKNGDLIAYMGAGTTWELHTQDGSLKEIALAPEVRWPQFLPGRDAYVYAAYDAATKRSHGMAADYASNKPVTLMETNSRVQYAPPRRSGEPGYLLFLRGASLLAQVFDADRLGVAGDPFPIAQNVIYYGPVLSANFSLSSTGVLVYQSGFPNAELKWYDRHGNEVGKVGRPQPLWGQVRLSRDGKRVAATVWSPEGGGTEVWIFDADGRESRQLTFSPEVGRRPVWAPDGTQLAVGKSLLVGGPQLATVDLATGKSQQFVAATDQPHGLPTDWSSDGKYIVFEDGLGEEVAHAWIGDVASHKFLPLFESKVPQWGTVFSPDNTQIAFVSVESGRPEVYLQRFEAAPSPRVVGDRRQVSRDGAWLVRWDGTGKELFYVGLDNTLYAAKVSGRLAFSEAERLFPIPGASQYGTTRDFQFDVSPDGKRFIMPTTGSVAPPPFTVIKNWQDKFHH